MPATRRIFEGGGVTFRRSFTTSPICCPSRASILTGRYPHNHGVLTNRHGSRIRHRTTIQRYLSSHGYRTAFFGKFLNSWNVRQDPPFFDEWSIFPQSSRGTYLGGTWNVNGLVRDLHQYSTTYIRERAMDFLRSSERHDRRPWFLALSTAAAHAPFLAEESYKGVPVSNWGGNPAVLESNLRDKPPSLRRKVADDRCSYACGNGGRIGQFRTLMSVDDLVNTVFGALTNLEEKRRTLAILVSDNGYFWGEHGLSDKRYPYAQSLRTPMFMRWAGRISPGTDARVVTNLDIAPTVLAAAGIQPSHPLDGKNLLSGSWRRSRLFAEYFRDPLTDVPSWASLRTSRYQYTEYYGREGVIFKEYYKLGVDPWQLKNLLGDADRSNNPPRTRIRRLSRRLAGDRSCAGSACP